MDAMTEAAVPGNLEALLARLAETFGAAAQAASVRQGEKQVTYRSSADLRDELRLVNEAENGPAKAVVLVPRRPSL
jgi:hypothetical protein